MESVRVDRHPVVENTLGGHVSLERSQGPGLSFPEVPNSGVLEVPSSSVANTFWAKEGERHARQPCSAGARNEAGKRHGSPCPLQNLYRREFELLFIFYRALETDV